MREGWHGVAAAVVLFSLPTLSFFSPSPRVSIGDAVYRVLRPASDAPDLYHLRPVQSPDFRLSRIPNLHKSGISEIRIPKIRISGIQKSGFSEIQKSRITGIRNFGKPDFRESGFPDFQKSGIPDFRKSEFPQIRNCVFSDFRNSRNLEILNSGCPEF